MSYDCLDGVYYLLVKCWWRSSVLLNRTNMINLTTKEVIRSVNRRKTDNTMIKQDKGTNNDLQNISQETKDRATRTPLQTRSEHECSGSVSSSCSTCGTRRLCFFILLSINRSYIFQSVSRHDLCYEVKDKKNL